MHQGFVLTDGLWSFRMVKFLQVDLMMMMMTEWCKSFICAYFIVSFLPLRESGKMHKLVF